MKLPFFSILIIIIMLNSCSSDAQTPQSEADKSVSEALANAKKLEAEILAKAAAKTAEVKANVEQKQKDAEAAKVKAAEEAKILATKETADLKIPGKGLSKYNGCYLNDFNNDRAFMLVDGKLFHFSLTRFKTTFKDEAHIIGGLTGDGKFNIKAKYQKSRKGVELKATVLTDVKPTLVDGKCSKLVRAGRTYVRMNTFREFVETKGNYSVSELIKNYKNIYKGSDAEIEKALNSKDFYKCSFFINAPFYGDQMPLTDALESIIN